jgi:hypothetical protein
MRKILPYEISKILSILVLRAAPLSVQNQVTMAFWTLSYNLIHFYFYFIHYIR